MYTHPMSLHTTLADHIPLNRDAVRYPDAYGVEIELEGVGVSKPSAEILSVWNPHPDHSLRAHNGGEAIEYVFNKPLPMDATVNAINMMFDFLNNPSKVKVFDSYRTSIHVHVNFGMETLRTIYNFIALSLILDELLVSQNGDHRIGNNFCLRAKDAMGQVSTLIQSISQGSEMFGISQNERYSSINFASLSKFGSIEFRSLECTTHKGRLTHWIGTLAQIKSISKTFKDPTEVLGAFSRMGVKEFLSMVLGPYAIKYLSVPGFESMLHTGMRIAQDFAYCSAWTAKDPASSTALKAAKAKKGPAVNAIQEIALPGWPVLGAVVAQQQPPQPEDWVLPDDHDDEDEEEDDDF